MRTERLLRAGRTPRWLVASVLVAGVTSGTVVMVPAPAAAVPGLVYELEDSAYDSAGTKYAIAWCPRGTTVLGGGGYLSTAHTQHQVFLTGLRPIVTTWGTGFQAIASEDDTGYAGKWTLFAQAVCAPPPRGLEYVRSPGRSSSRSLQWVQTWCPTGKNLLGTGAMIANGHGHVGLSHILPLPNPPNRVFVQAHEDETGYGGNWSLTGWAVCADPPRGLELVGAGHQRGEDYATVNCPGSTQSHGAGGFVEGDPAEVRLVGISPIFGVGATAQAEPDETGYSGDWQAVAYAVCGS